MPLGLAFFVSALLDAGGLLAYWSVEDIATATQCPVSNVRSNWPILAAACSRHNITDPLSLVGVFGTIATETASTFAPVREAYYLNDIAAQYRWYADTTKHAPYNGGVEYHGRGFVQTTHKYNYQRIMDITGIDVVSNPDLLLQPEAASEALCIYWNDHGLTAKAQAQDWLGIRRSVYGGQDIDGANRIGRIANYLMPRLVT